MSTISKEKLSLIARLQRCYAEFCCLLDNGVAKTVQEEFIKKEIESLINIVEGKEQISPVCVKVVFDCEKTFKDESFHIENPVDFLIEKRVERIEAIVKSINKNGDREILDAIENMKKDDIPLNNDTKIIITSLYEQIEILKDFKDYSLGMDNDDLFVLFKTNLTAEVLKDYKTFVGSNDSLRFVSVLYLIHEITELIDNHKSLPYSYFKIKAMDCLCLTKKLNFSYLLGKNRLEEVA